MQIDLTIDTAELVGRLNKGQRRLAYAVVNAINSTSRRIQTAEFEHIEESFEVRRPAFWFGAAKSAAKIKPFANVKQGRAFSEIAMEAPAGRGRVDRRFLGPVFERGGVRTPSWPGAKQIAVPITGTPSRPTWSSQVTPALTFAQMRLAKYRAGKRVRRKGQRASRTSQGVFDTSGTLRLPGREPGVQWRGAHGTFMVLRDGGGTVFQRVGGKAVPIYVLRRPMPLRPRLHWMRTAQSVADAWFKEEMEREVVNAIARAKGRGL